MRTFRERLIELREGYDMDQQSLAKRIGVSKAAISRYESNEMQPTLRVMLKIKKEFGVSLDWLAGYEDAEKQQYTQIINDCESADIKPEKLQQIIDILKKS
jgi:transcriptional regulator with XRE-family HTH domain